MKAPSDPSSHERLRALYEDLSDDDLRRAFERGREGYGEPDIWEVIDQLYRERSERAGAATTSKLGDSRPTSAGKAVVQRTTLSPRTIALEMGILLALPAYWTIQTFGRWDSPTAANPTARSVSVAIDLAATSAMVCYLIWRDKGSLASIGLGGVRIGKTALVAAFMFLTEIAGWLAASPLASTMRGVHRQPPHVWPVHAEARAAFVVSVLISALYEEFLFRGYLLSRLEDLKVNRFLAVVGAAAFFAAGHPGPRSALYAFITGLTFGVAFFQWRSLMGLGIAHCAWNLFVDVISS